MAKKKSVPAKAIEGPITRKEIAEVTVTMYSTFRQMINHTVPAIATVVRDVGRIADSLEKLAEFERQKRL